MRIPFALVLLLAVSAQAQVLPNDAILDGKTIGDWSAEWFKWILPIPISHNPDLDTNGVFAAVGQPEGDVFFIAYELGIVPGATYVRTFTVPEGKYLFLPLELYEADNVDTFPPLSLADLRAQAAAMIYDVKELHASLDGVDIPNLFDHRAISPVFNIFYTNSDNIHTFGFGHPITGLIDPMVVDGYWLMLDPLPPGPHLLHFSGSFSHAFFLPSEVLDYIMVVPANHPPVADASATALRIISPNNVTSKVVLDGSRSSDSDNDPLTYVWLEGVSVLSMAVISTNTLSVGTHVIILVVSDGNLSATNTITVHVMTPCQAIAELASQIEAAQLPRRKMRPLVEELREACAAFEHGFRARHRDREDHIERAVQELREFQREVTKDVTRGDPAVAASLTEGAKEIVDAVTPQSQQKRAREKSEDSDDRQ